MKAASNSSVPIPASSSRLERKPRVKMERCGERQVKTLATCVTMIPARQAVVACR